MFMGQARKRILDRGEIADDNFRMFCLSANPGDLTLHQSARRPKPKLTRLVSCYQTILIQVMQEKFILVELAVLV
ncbi:MAG: hypothetical protein ABS79_01445 [Planctomycetes bacterium SCN 63-9]|nr:MAG: hypothetical protein ABS79_01445 [Planctomycetes bacterium SCN 63-9]